jgi:antitoxin ParD1/3/4
MSGMNIPLTSEQLAWLQQKVASGQFSSIEEAAVAAIDDTMASESDDMSWARPLVDEARASIERGECLTHDQFKNFLADERRKLG